VIYHDREIPHGNKPVQRPVYIAEVLTTTPVAAGVAHAIAVAVKLIGVVREVAVIDTIGDPIVVIIRITRITQTVVVNIPSDGRGQIRTVVTRVAVRIAVAIGLIWIVKFRAVVIPARHADKPGPAGAISVSIGVRAPIAGVTDAVRVAVIRPIMSVVRAVITSIAVSVPIAVRLIRVVKVRAVVANVAHAVTIAVKLSDIAHRGAVIGDIIDTVTIAVGATRITLTVFIGVFLSRIVLNRAVVAIVTPQITVAIELT
jgi:hypothetical protein